MRWNHQNIGKLIDSWLLRTPIRLNFPALFAETRFHRRSGSCLHICALPRQAPRSRYYRAAELLLVRAVAISKGTCGASKMAHPAMPALPRLMIVLLSVTLSTTSMEARKLDSLSATGRSEFVE